MYQKCKGGSNLTSLGDRSFVLNGTNNNSTGTQSITGGSNCTATGITAIAIGNDNSATSNSSIALGRNATSQHTGTMVFSANAGTTYESKGPEGFHARVPGAVTMPAGYYTSPLTGATTGFVFELDSSVTNTSASKNYIAGISHNNGVNDVGTISYFANNSANWSVEPGNVSHALDILALDFTTTSGFQGPQGIVGTSGASGFQGPQGLGTDGPQGWQGPIGSQGFRGFQGVNINGFQGFQGATGFQGFQGNYGISGNLSWINLYNNVNSSGGPLNATLPITTGSDFVYPIPIAPNRMQSTIDFYYADTETTMPAYLGKIQYTGSASKRFLVIFVYAANLTSAMTVTFSFYVSSANNVTSWTVANSLRHAYQNHVTTAGSSNVTIGTTLTDEILLNQNEYLYIGYQNTATQVVTVDALSVTLTEIHSL